MSNSSSSPYRIDLIIIGCVLGGVVLVITIVAFVFCVRYCMNKKRDYHGSTVNLRKNKNSAIGMDELDEPIDSKTQQEDNDAMMNAMMFLRGQPRYKIKQALMRVGSRRGKHFFLLNEVGRTKDGKERIIEDVAVLELIEQGADCPVSVSAETVTFEHMFQETWRAHPNISAPLVVEVIPTTNTLAIIRPWYSRGSLRDFIHQTDPKLPYNQKYRSNSGPLPVKIIAKFGRDILEGMLFLKQLGFPCYNLHAGNILIDPPNGCFISDFENNILCVNPHHADIIRTLASKRVQPDVACFACILYEMAAGTELTSVEAADILLSPASSCPDEVRNTLSSILNPWATTPPDVEDLLRTDFFARVEISKPIPKLTITMPQKVHQLFLSSAEALAQSVIQNKSSSSAVVVKGVRSPSHHHHNIGGVGDDDDADFISSSQLKKTEKSSLLGDGV